MGEEIWFRVERRIRDKFGNISVQWYYILPFVGTGATGQEQKHGGRKEKTVISIMVSENTVCSWRIRRKALTPAD